MNYTSLTNQIIAWTNRNEPTFVAVIPDIINQAMSRIYSQAKTLGFQKTITGQMQLGINRIDKPDDFKSPIYLKITLNTGINPNHKFLLERTYEFCTAYSPYINVLGEPTFYSTDLDVPQVAVAPSRIFISPTPDQAYLYSLSYLSFPPLFNAANATNFLTDRYPNLLLYSCMMEAIPYLKSDERIQVWENLYNRALQDVNKDTDSRYIDRYSNRGKD